MRKLITYLLLASFSCVNVTQCLMDGIEDVHDDWSDDDDEKKMTCQAFLKKINATLQSATIEDKGFSRREISAINSVIRAINRELKSLEQVEARIKAESEEAKQKSKKNIKKKKKRKTRRRKKTQQYDD